MLRDYSLLIGATGWMHPEWQTDYYPDDLPQDWQLGYYSNDFPVVMVTRKEWLYCEQTEDCSVENWLDDTESSLRFVIELDAEEADISKWQVKLDAFNNRLLGIVMSFTELPTIEQLQEHYATWQNHYSLCMDFNTLEPGDELVNEMRHAGIGCCWHGEGESAGLNYGDLLVARVETKNKTPRDLRSIVETMLLSKSAKQRVLLFEGSPPSIEVMQNAGIILDLL